MLIVSGTISVAAGDHERMIELLGPLVEPTLAEDGNLTYGMWPHPTERGLFRVYEEWESAEKMGPHMASEHMATFMAGMGELEVTGVELHQHEVSESSRFM